MLNATILFKEKIIKNYEVVKEFHQIYRKKASVVYLSLVVVFLNFESKIRVNEQVINHYEYCKTEEKNNF